MRRIFPLLLVLAGLASPSQAANKTQTVTVAQLGQWLASAHDQADGKVAKGLESMVLTERVSAAQLAQWQSDLPGRHSHEALTALAGVSVLLPAPATEVLADAPPDLKAQGGMLSHAIDYVVQTLAKLPDFYATRTTEHFEDSPAREGIQSIQNTTNTGELSTLSRSRGVPFVTRQDIPYQPLHHTGQSSVPVSYRDGVEMRGLAKMDRAAINLPESGLTTAGEFGPILSVVLDDAIHGLVEWGYWQQGPQGKLAVFRYKVADGHSSFVLALKHGTHDEKLFPAYRGEIAIDPASGAILRITVLASSMRSQDVMESAITVDYGAVSLGGANYICPVKGVALLKTSVDDPQSATSLHTQLNDVTFTGYHLMRGDMTILPAQP